jgi:hypothetical protein
VESPSRPDREIPPHRSTALLAAIAAGYALLHLAVVGRYGYFRDELYYLACGRHLAWGYVDHPPLIAFLARSVERTLGDSLLALRLPAILAGASAVALTGLFARGLGGGRFAQALAAIGFAIAPTYLFLFHILSMNALEPLFWTGAAWVLVRLLEGADPRLWLLFGAIAGLGLLNKHSMLLFGFAIFAGLLATPERRLLKSPWPWLGGLLASLMFLPNLLWEARHGWPTLEFARNAEAIKNVHDPAGFLLGQLGLIHPLGMLLALVGLAAYVVSPALRRFRVFAWAYLIILGVYLVQASKPYYLAPIYPLLLAAGAVTLERWTAEKSRWLRPAAFGLLLVGGAVAAPITLPLLSEEGYIRYADRLGIHPESGERHTMGLLPQHFADMHGWPELTAAVARVYDSLPPAERARCGIFGQNYGEAGAIDLFGPRYGLPAALSAHNSYYLWGPRGYTGECLIVLNDSAESLGRLFGEVRQAGTFTCRYCMPYETDMPIQVCRKPKVPLPDFWPRIKKFV